MRVHRELKVRPAPPQHSGPNPLQYALLVPRVWFLRAQVWRVILSLSTCISMAGDSVSETSALVSSSLKKENLTLSHFWGLDRKRSWAVRPLGDPDCLVLAPLSTFVTLKRHQLRWNQSAAANAKPKSTMEKGRRAQWGEVKAESRRRDKREPSEERSSWDVWG